MTSVLLLQSPDPVAPALVDHLTAAGFTICGQGDCAHLVREALRTQPDVVVCWAPRADDALLESVAILQRQQSIPLLVFTHDADVDRMQRALEAGVHAWVVQGYAPHRVRALVAQARAREAHERSLREHIAELESRLAERKLVDRAKGILMRSSQLSEEEAFKVLRTASMHGNLKVGQVSQHVIDAARVAEAINRAGQQRMLSQRLVKLQALVCHGTDLPAATLLIRETVARVEDNLAMLERELAPASFGDLLSAGRTAWAQLRQGLDAASRDASRLGSLDRQAEAVLAHADAVVRALESSGLARTVEIVNRAGRQRMLSQRVAKLALLLPTAADPAALRAELERTSLACREGLRALVEAPLSTPDIRTLLLEGEQAWRTLLAAVPQSGQPAGRLALAASSEDLLALFDRLTAAYQHSVDLLVGA